MVTNMLVMNTMFQNMLPDAASVPNTQMTNATASRCTSSASKLSSSTTAFFGALFFAPFFAGFPATFSVKK